MSIQLPKAGGVVVALFAACQTGLGVQQPSADPARAPDYARALQFIDADNNGKIEHPELAVAQQSAALILALDWAEADTDRDGSLSTPEFTQAAAKTMQTLLADRPAAEDREEQRAQEDLASAVPFTLVIERMARSPRYAEEVAALRKALADAGDDEVIAHVAAHPALYPRLTPLLRTWLHSYPLRPALLRHLKPSARPRIENPPPAPSLRGSGTQAPANGH
jgi:hypothetical protein